MKRSPRGSAPRPAGGRRLAHQAAPPGGVSGRKAPRGGGEGGRRRETRHLRPSGLGALRWPRSAFSVPGLSGRAVCGPALAPVGGHGTSYAPGEAIGNSNAEWRDKRELSGISLTPQGFGLPQGALVPCPAQRVGTRGSCAPGRFARRGGAPFHSNAREPMPSPFPFTPGQLPGRSEADACRRRAGYRGSAR